jgi:hypothetical protein
VAFDHSGNVVLVGVAGAGAFDFGGGTIAALGSADGFIAKFSATNGAHLWSRRMGSTANDYAYGVAIDNNNNVFVTGSIEGAANIGGISLTLFGLQGDAFVAMFNSSGSAIWAENIGGTGADTAKAIAINPAGTTLGIVGYFYGSATFGTAVSSAGQADGFLMKMTP